MLHVPMYFYTLIPYYAYFLTRNDTQALKNLKYETPARVLQKNMKKVIISKHVCKMFKLSLRFMF